MSIHTAGRLFLSVVYLFTQPVENNYDNYIDRARAFFLSFCYAFKRPSPFFLYIPTKKTLFNDKVWTYFRILVSKRLKSFSHNQILVECRFFLSQRELTFMFAVSSRSLNAIARPSVVCNVCAPYSAGWNFRQFIFAIWYLAIRWHPRKSLITEIVPGDE